MNLLAVPNGDGHGTLATGVGRMADAKIPVQIYPKKRKPNAILRILAVIAGSVTGSHAGWYVWLLWIMLSYASPPFVRYVEHHFWARSALAYFGLVAVLAIIFGTIKLAERKVIGGAFIPMFILGLTLSGFMVHLYVLFISMGPP
jgi:hypothetical protein